MTASKGPSPIQGPEMLKNKNKKKKALRASIGKRLGVTEKSWTGEKLL